MFQVVLAVDTRPTWGYVPAPELPRHEWQEDVTTATLNSAAGGIELPAWQQGRLAIFADAVPSVRVLAFVYNQYRATVTVLQSMANDNGYLKGIGLVVTSVHRRAVTVADHHLEPLFAGNHLGRSFLPGRKRSA